MALLPVLALVILLGLAYYLYGDGAAAGPNQIALLFCVLVAFWVGHRLGYTAQELGEGAVESIKEGISAIFILLAVGSLIGTWAMSGTLMAMVYWGLQILSPSYFYLTTVVICALVALCIGSSWTVAGTIGIGMLGIAQEMDLSLPITAGAVISGAYFGDKSSPLSDATNLATVAAGSDLYTHIKETLWTSVPSLVVVLIFFWFMGEPSDFDPGDITAGIAAEFDTSFLPFLPLILVLALAITRWQAFTTIFLGALAGGLLAVIIAPERVLDGKHADHRLVDPDSPGIRWRRGKSEDTGSHYRASDQGCKVNWCIGFFPGSCRRRHQCAGLGSVYRYRTARKNVPEGLSRQRAGAGRTVTGGGRFRHGYLCPDSME
jgi:NhaC family Na+:H+ antiporter